METRKEFSKNLIYFSNFQKIDRITTYCVAAAWFVCVTLNVSYIYSGNVLDYFDQNTYLPLIGFTFVVPQIFAICEAWANALMITLFNSLQFDDYNKRYMGKNYFKQLKKQQRSSSKKGEHSNDDTSIMPMVRPLLLSE
jgi:hypothetical protein